jgi:hypothetical protein
MKLVSTSYVERQNLTVRMQMRRLTRLTNAFSEKLDNLKAAYARHCAHYIFVRIRQTLGATPAMAAGVTDRLWSIGNLIEEAAVMPARKERRPSGNASLRTKKRRTGKLVSCPVHGCGWLGPSEKVEEHEREKHTAGSN